MEYIQAADEGGLYWFASHHTRLGNKVMLFFSEVGDLEVSCSLVGVAILLFILAGRWRTAIVFVLAALFGLGFSQGVKYLLMRDRPDVAWKMVELPESPSFPSGHSFNSMNLYGSLALLASRHVRRRAVAILILVACFALPLMIGISRPYLGVHYPSDVFAGWTGGLACALLALWADQRWGDRERFAPVVSPPADLGSLPTPSTGGEGIRPALK